MSAMVVRELFAKLGLDTDFSSFKRGDAAMKGVERTAFSLRDAFKYIGVAAVGAFAANVVRSASDVDETLNVIQASFGENADSVTAWAADTSKAMGRSQYVLRDMAASLGAILHPMLQNDQAAAQYSTTLSGLAVDLASFFNTTEKDALVALRSGLVGETEPLRRYGVVLNETRLKEEARALGLAKGKGTLSAAVKAQAAYSLIMKDTAAAQGDAVRTGGGYANLLRRLEGAWLDFKIAVGSVLLGPAGDLLKWLVGAANGAADLISQTNVLQASLIAIGAALVPFIGAWIVANAPLILAAAALAAIVLVIEDIYTAMTGGKSVIDQWFSDLIGKESWIEVKKTWQEEFEKLIDMIRNFATEAQEAAGPVWELFTGGATKFVAKRLTKFVAGQTKGVDPKAVKAQLEENARNSIADTLGVRLKDGANTLNGGAAPSVAPSTPAAAPAPASSTVSAPTTIIVQGARNPEETGRVVRKHLDDRDRDLRRSASGVE